MSKPTETDDTGFKVKDKTTSIPNKWIIYLIIGLIGYGPGRDGLSLVLPQRGKTATDQVANRLEANNQQVASKLDANTQQILDQLKNIPVLEVKLDALVATVAEIKSTSDSTSKRVDRLYENLIIKQK